jgi:membrane protease YdiL (CAAX protease family)
VLARRPPGRFAVTTEIGRPSWRQRLAVTATLLVGTGLLATTLRVPAGSTGFLVLGLLAAVTWIFGSLISGPIPLGTRPFLRREVVSPAIGLGLAAFLAFLGADLLGQHLPIIAPALHTILAKADAGPTWLVLAVALVNAIGEECFFRGSLFGVLGSHHPVASSTITYVAVTATTANLALVIAAALMGTLFALQRERTGTIVAPVTTHLCWSTLMLLALPR